jgi:hypothetical protein
MPNVNLQALEEQIAKAKEDLEFLEKARAVLADPRISGILGPQPRPVTATQIDTSPITPKPYGELKDKVFSFLPEADTRADITVNEIVEKMLAEGYRFTAKEYGIAVNGALVALEAADRAQTVGKKGNAKLWRKKKQRISEASTFLQDSLPMDSVTQ